MTKPELINTTFDKLVMGDEFIFEGRHCMMVIVDPDGERIAVMIDGPYKGSAHRLVSSNVQKIVRKDT